jgi:drug/metabolite transporter (DMT)-like permease
VAVGVISGSSGGGVRRVSRRRALAMAVLAGAGFGLFFICLSRAPAGGGFWPLAGARVSSLAAIAVPLLAGRGPERPVPEAVRAAALSGVLDITGNALFLLAVRSGELALVAVLSSLYPAATVLLAFGILRERLRLPQLAGVGLALVAVGLIASG